MYLLLLLEEEEEEEEEEEGGKGARWGARPCLAMMGPA
jgi:hypothetical protein